ncbi:hypothetical protein AAG906_039109 [Vitis piasezkii]
MANRLNRLRNRSTGCAHPIEDQSRRSKPSLSHPLEPKSKCKKIGSLVEASSYFDKTKGIREGDEDIEVSPSKWHTKVIAIQEAKDLTKLPMEELIGSLMTYEINLTKNIALKATTNEEEDVEGESQVMKMMI